MLLQEVSSAAKAGSTRKRMVARERHALLALLDQARAFACRMSSRRPHAL